MQLLNSLLVLGTAMLATAQNVTLRFNGTTIVPVIRTPLPPIISTSTSAINYTIPGWRPGKPGYNNGTVTVVVGSYTTYCPTATVITINGQKYTATGPTLLTITNCPCTLTKPAAGNPTQAPPPGIPAPPPPPGVVYTPSNPTVIPQSPAPQQSVGPQQGPGPQQSSSPQQSYAPQPNPIPQQSSSPQQSHAPQPNPGPQQSYAPQPSPGPQQSSSPQQSYAPQPNPGPQQSSSPQQSYAPQPNPGPGPAGPVPTTLTGAAPPGAPATDTGKGPGPAQPTYVQSDASERNVGIFAGVMIVFVSFFFSVML
ncbi:hypothetical protein diail_3323 [Diaporthe ilicicola]|nr:hypothetical protein diail_3323 [Diaporthe ilicicola]